MTEWIGSLDSRSKGLGFDSRYWSCVEVLNVNVNVNHVEVYSLKSTASSADFTRQTSYSILPLSTQQGWVPGGTNS